MKREVTIIQELLPQYRVPFFEGLRLLLDASDVRLRLVHGARHGPESKSDERSLPWAETCHNRVLHLPHGREAIWQPVFWGARSSNLVVVEHASRHLATGVLLAARRAGLGPRVGFWGHGANLRASPQDILSERLKRSASLLADWWFAYTEGSAQRVVAHGFPGERITVVNNTIDAPPVSSTVIREPFTCVFVGALYSNKGLSFLLESGRLLAEAVPEFRLVVLGDGEQRDLLKTAAAKWSWLDYRGVAFGQVKAEVLSASSLMLIPSSVGLAIVDAFAYGCPLITIDSISHGPEIEYLKSGTNGLTLPVGTTPADYASFIQSVLYDDGLRARLAQGCAESFSELSMAAMVERFAGGVLRALP